MTTTKIISVKIPDRLLRLMPPAGKGRSQFVISALKEKISRQDSSEWQSKTQRGRRLATLLKKGRQERRPVLDREEVTRELTERRGCFH